MDNREFRTYKYNDWLWDYLDSTDTPYRYDPVNMVYIVYGTVKKHEYIASQLKQKGVKLE